MVVVHPAALEDRLTTRTCLKSSSPTDRSSRILTCVQTVDKVLCVAWEFLGKPGTGDTLRGRSQLIATCRTFY